jgi:two-component system, OmpR family, sensor kinase
VVALSLRARLLAALAYVLVLAVVALLVPLVRSVRARVDAEVRTQALAQAELVAASAPGTTDLAGLARRAGANVRGRVVIVGPRGRLRADSASAATLGADYSGRPEIRRALRGAVAQLQRASGTLGERILATAVPVVVAGRPSGAVRVTQGVPAVHRAIDAATLGLTAIGGLVLVLGLAAGAVIAGQIAAPLRGLAGVARRVEAGEEEVRAVEEGSAEQRALARAFNDMTARVARTLGAQRQFVADASHQLRTPLAGLRLRLEEAAVAAGNGPARRQIAGALGEVDRMASIVGELLVLSEAEEPAGGPERADPGAAARAAANRWTPAAGETGSRVAAEGDGGPVRCSPADLDRILDALVDNALAYGPPGQIVRVTAAGGRLEVRDGGAGVAPEEAEAVFARFHRGSAGRAGPPGTGLGLPIARELARRWGGDVTLDGPRAVVRLPEAAP